MKRDFIIVLSFLFIILALVFLIQEYYVPVRKIYYKYSPTDFIEPSRNFINCYQNSDCIKTKGSVCPVTVTCVNKNYLQEYISKIENLAGSITEVNCPEEIRTDKYECFCIDSICKLVSQ